jgi:hypothetical protein
VETRFLFVMIDFLKRRKLLIAITLAGMMVLSCIGTPLMMMGSLFESVCEGPPEIIHEMVSPAGDKKAIAYLTSCGATTSYTPRVSVLLANDSLVDSRGYVRRPYKGEVYAGEYRDLEVGIRWADNDTLLIEHPGVNAPQRCANSTNPPATVKCE